MLRGSASSSEELEEEPSRTKVHIARHVVLGPRLWRVAVIGPRQQRVLRRPGTLGLERKRGHQLVVDIKGGEQGRLPTGPARQLPVVLLSSPM